MLSEEASVLYLKEPDNTAEITSSSRLLNCPINCAYSAWAGYAVFSLSFPLAGIDFVLGASRVKKYSEKIGIHIRNAPRRVEGKKDDGSIRVVVIIDQNVVVTE